MQPKLLSRKRTFYVQLDTGKCKGCWKCLEDCQKQIIGKIDFPWHRHVRITHPEKCSGCLKCIRVCQNNAFSKIDNAAQ